MKPNGILVIAICILKNIILVVAEHIMVSISALVMVEKVNLIISEQRGGCCMLVRVI